MRMTGKALSLVASALFYAAPLAMANGAAAQSLAEVVEPMREGDMRKLVVHSEPVELPDQTFTDPDGSEYSLADYAGQVVLVNFWATWCAPCREEMPDLDALQQTFGGDAFEVVTIATGRNSLAGIRAFFQEEEIEALPILLDPQGQLARRAGVLGLPVTVIMGPDGMELARLQGGAHWNDENARALLTEIMAQSGV